MASITFTNEDVNQLIHEIRTFLQQIGAANVTAQPVPYSALPLPATLTAPVQPAIAPVVPVQNVPASQMTPPPAAIPTVTPDYTHEQLGRAIAAWVDKAPDNRKKALDILNGMGCQGVTQLDTPEKRGKFAVLLRAQGVQI